MKIILTSATIFLILIGISELFALPRFSLKTGFQCIDCHQNPTGGIARNEDGWRYGKNSLSMVRTSNSEFAISPKIGENIFFGFDFRTQYLIQLKDSIKRSDFHKMSGSTYSNIELSEEISIIARYDFIQRIFEGYGVLKVLPNNSYFKIGTFTPAYGIRLDDHTSYSRGGDYGLLFSSGTRQGLIYNPSYTETGIELGVFISDFALFNLSAGQSNYPFQTDPTYTARVEFSQDFNLIKLMAGGSLLAFRDSLEVKMFGGFFGLGVGNFTLLTEINRANNYLGRNIKTTTFMAEASYQILKGIDAIIRYDSFHPDKDISDYSFAHLILGLEIFPYSFIEIRPQYRFNLEKPNKIANDAVVVQFHFWY